MLKMAQQGRGDAELEDMRAERDEAILGRVEAVRELAEVKQKMEQEVGALKERLAVLEETTRTKAALRAAALKGAEDFIGNLTSINSRMDKAFHDMKSDLLARLQSACAQLDEARVRVLELESEISKLKDPSLLQPRVKGNELAVPPAASGAAIAAEAVAQPACDGADISASSAAPSAAAVAAPSAAAAAGVDASADSAALGGNMTKTEAAVGGASAMSAAAAHSDSVGVSGITAPVGAVAFVPTVSAPAMDVAGAPTVAPAMDVAGAPTVAPAVNTRARRPLFQRLQTSSLGSAVASSVIGGRLPTSVESFMIGSVGDELVYVRNPIGSAAAAAGVPENEADRRVREAHMKQAAMLAEKRKAEDDRLLTALKAPLPNSSSVQQGEAPLGMGFHKGRPVAAIVMFRYCLHSGALQADRTTLFDRIQSVICQLVERGQEDNNCLSYWLTNTVTLLHLFNKNVKPASSNHFMSKAGSGGGGGGDGITAAAAAARSALGSILGSCNGVVPPGSPSHAEASTFDGGAGGFKQVEAKYPALLFKQQLDALVQKIFPMIRDNVRKEISPMLNNCIYALSSKVKGYGCSAQQQASAPDKPWTDILHVLDTLLGVTQANHVPKVLVQALFTQLFRFINVQLFNQLLLRRECCSASNGERLKMGVIKVARWITGAGCAAGADFVSKPWEELKHLRQAVTFLVTEDKPSKRLPEITSELCPDLSIQQLYRISTMYWDDKHNTETVSAEVLSRMKQAMVDSNSTASHSFLLDDDSSLPFQVAVLLANADDKDLYGTIPVPEVLQQDGAAGAATFAFLEKGRQIESTTAATGSSAVVASVPPAE